MSKKVWILIGIIVLIALIFIGVRSCSKTVTVPQTFEVARQDLTEVISEVGKVVPVQEINLSFSMSGKVAKISVKEGEPVKKGAELARLDTVKAQANLTSAQAAVNEAQARVDKAYAGASEQDVKISETALKNSESALANLRLSTEKDIASSEASVTSANTAFENAKKALVNQQDQNTESFKQAYEDAIAALGDAFTKADKALKTNDYILDKYTPSGYTVNADIVRVNTNLTDDFVSIQSAIKKLEIGKTDAIDTALTNTLAFVNELADNLTDIRGILQDELSVIATVTDKGYVDTERTSIDTAISGVSAAMQAVTSSKLTGKVAEDGAKARVTEAENALTKAQANLESSRALSESGIADAQGALQLAKDQLALKTAAPRREDMDLYKAQLAQAIAYADVVREDFNNSFIFAPTDGVITQVHSEDGELATMASPVISMMATGKHQIEAMISELDIARIKIADPVDVTFDAFGRERIFKGKVIEMNPYETDVEGDIYYKVTIALEEYDEGIRSGMTANLEIKTDEKAGVLVIPSRYIGEESGKKFVKVLNAAGGGSATENFTTVEVTTGLKGLEMTEIVSGLDLGQQIIPYY